MVMPNFRVGATPVTARVRHAANHAAFGVSDYHAVSETAARKRFTRPVVGNSGFEFAAPGARVRFVTNSRYVTVHLAYTGLVTRLDTYNSVTALLANGVIVGSVAPALGASNTDLVVDLGTRASRTVELVLPYCASVDFLGVSLEAAAVVSAAAARPVTRYVAGGDSITHGFTAGSIGTAWTYGLAAEKNWQCVNLGYGSAGVNGAVGTLMAATNPTVATYLIGYNNFYPQTPLATFLAEYTQVLANFRAGGTTAKLYCITPLWTDTYATNVIPIEQYRQQIRNAVTASANPLNILVEGATLTTNARTSLPDGVHPNDLGATQIKTALASIVAV